MGRSGGPMVVLSTRMETAEVKTFFCRVKNADGAHPL